MIKLYLNKIRKKMFHIRSVSANDEDSELVNISN